MCRRPYGASLADTESRKDPPEQIVRTDFAGDFAESLCSQPQLFRKQIQLPIADRRMRPRYLQVLARGLQRLQVSLASEEQRLATRFAPADPAQQLSTQHVEARTGLG